MNQLDQNINAFLGPSPPISSLDNNIDTFLNSNVVAPPPTLPEKNPIHQFGDYFTDEPGTTYGNILPFSQNDKTGETNWDFPEIIRTPARGLAELLEGAGGERRPATDNPLDPMPGNLSGDALTALMMTASPGTPAAEKNILPYNKGQEGKKGVSFLGSGLILPPEVNAPIYPKSGDLTLIMKKLDLAGISPQQYAEALTKSSPEDFAGELGGEPLRMQTQAQAKITGPSMQAARDAMHQRLQGAPQRAQQLIENTFMPAQNIENLQNNLGEIEQKLPLLYKEAGQQTVPATIADATVSTPAGQQALKNTVLKLKNQGIDLTDAGISIDENGVHGFASDVPVNTVHEFSKSLGDQVKRNPVTGAVEGSDSAVIENMRKGITSSLSKASPAFNAANTHAAAQLQGQSAFEMGRQLAKSAAGETQDALVNRGDQVFSANELSYQKAGYTQGLLDKIQGAPLGTGNPVARIATGNVQNTASQILQNPARAQQFADAIMQEKNRIDLAQRGLGGSNSAETLGSGIPEIPTSLTGGIMSALGKAKDFVQAGKNERIAQLLYATSPEQKAILAKRILGK